MLVPIDHLVLLLLWCLVPFAVVFLVLGLFGRLIFIQCGCWGEICSRWGCQTPAQYWITIVHPWVQKFYPVLGLGSEGRLLWHFQTPALYWTNFSPRLLDALSMFAFCYCAVRVAADVSCIVHTVSTARVQEVRALKKGRGIFQQCGQHGARQWSEATWERRPTSWDDFMPSRSMMCPHVLHTFLQYAIDRRTVVIMMLGRYGHCWPADLAPFCIVAGGGMA